MKGFSPILPHMISIITIFLFLLPLQSSRTHIQGLQIEKVSGEDENYEKEALFVEKFRALLGLKSFKGEKPDKNGYFYSPSPSPLPSPEAPAPAPVLPIHHHLHYPPPVHHPSLQKKIHKEHNNGRFRTILVAVLVPVGVAFAICALGLIWFVVRFRKRKPKSIRTISVNLKKGRSRSGKAGSKVSLNPGLDLLYLSSLGRDLEQQSICLKQATREESNGTGELLKSKPESDNVSSSSTREIMSVHEDIQSVKYESDGNNGGDKVVPFECHSSDDESFHSLVDSHCSNIRLSSASAGSLNDNISEIASANDPAKEFAPPAPPPPPPPPPPPARTPNIRLPPPRASSWSTRIRPRGSSPLRPSSSIPPPPCPPPFLKGNSSSSAKCPPPPPFGLPGHTPLGKDGAPLAKLKPLHWDKVRAAPDRSMVWDKIRSSSFELDEEMIELLFGYNLHSTMKNEEAKSKTPSPSKHVLEPKRLQNITILSKALNSTPEQVCEALIRGDGLSLQQLEALSKMAPTKEEEAKLNGYKGDINELGSAERFVKALLSIPFAFHRVEAMLYRETFEDEVVHLRNSFSMLEEACKELRSSRLFLKLLEAVLKTGNRMNVGTIRGGARAFKLDTLLKLADVKGTDGRTTLLHFVVQEIIRSEGIRVSDSIMGKIDQKNKLKSTEEKEEDYRRMGLDLVSGLSTELYNVKKTATIDLDVVASSVSNLSDGMAKLQQLVMKVDDKGGNFVNSMKMFLNYAEKKLKELEEDENGVMVHVREITEYFHGSVSKDEANPLRIFVIVRDFMGMLDHVCKELRNLRVPSCPNPLAPFR